ncbi:hypothetical protein FZEAL_2353 [Fusarium zealandicum]|uniref:Xylanolytic transcriptional activator regulatory domain-containing protein n=1 Tax=Fusarium zealandicum TaxID=1053134 RepID=A0A8H4URL8_9HYPO|nr:hypothetical protein FZEAL_2353 [Fusarium zealandicum]
MWEAPDTVFSFTQSVLLPEMEATQILVQSYFVNTQGLLEIVDKESIEMTVAQVYDTTIEVQPSRRCLLYLVMAIGFTMGPSHLNQRQSDIIDRLYSQDQWDQKIFATAKSLSDFLPGYEDGGICSIQAQALMSFFMLTVSKWNAASTYCGLAVRSAYAVGLHRGQETDCVFEPSLMVLRRKVWRSLFILDKLLAASLGRPSAITEQDCADDSLNVPDLVDKSSFGATAEVCQIISKILGMVYSTRSISFETAHILLEALKFWSVKLLDDWKVGKLSAPTSICARPGASGAASTMRILHLQLLGYYAKILICRPFFLHHFNQSSRDGSGTVHVFDRQTRMYALSRTCYIESLETIVLVKMAARTGQFPRFEPLVLHFLFDAILIVLCSRYADMHYNPMSISMVSHAVNILERCANFNLEAQQMVSVVHSFCEVVEQEMQVRASNANAGDEKNSRARLSSLCSHGSLYSPISDNQPVPNYQLVQTPYDGLLSPKDSQRGSRTLTQPWARFSPMSDDASQSRIMSEFKRSPPLN